MEDNLNNIACQFTSYTDCFLIMSICVSLANRDYTCVMANKIFDGAYLCLV